MRSTVELLDAVKRQQSITSDYELARELGVSRQAVSKYRHGACTFDNLTAFRVAELLKMSPVKVLAIIGAERTKRPEQRKKWQEIAKVAIFASALIGAGVFAPAGSARGSASSSSACDADIHYARSRRWRWRPKLNKRHRFPVLHAIPA